MFDRGYYCYKWIKDGEIVYIGKTVTPKLRISQERRTDKFQQVLDADIFVTEFTNATEMNAVEKILINKYQPRLNVVDRNEVFTELPFDDTALTWISFSAAEKEVMLDRKIAENNRKIKDLEFKIKKLRILKQLIGQTETMLYNGITVQTFDDAEFCSIVNTVYKSCIYEKSAEELQGYFLNKIGESNERYGTLSDAFDKIIVNWEDQFYSIALAAYIKQTRSYEPVLWYADYSEDTMKIMKTIHMIIDFFAEDIRLYEQSIKNLTAEILASESEKLSIAFSFAA